MSFGGKAVTATIVLTQHAFRTSIKMTRRRSPHLREADQVSVAPPGLVWLSCSYRSAYALG
jgi:hypothetical protein